MYSHNINSIEKEATVQLNGNEVLTILRLLHNSKADEKLHKDFYVLYEILMHKSLDKAALSLAYDMMCDKGEWTFDPLAGDWICSECDLHSMEHGRYCSNCGVEMRIEK